MDDGESKHICIEEPYIYVVIGGSYVVIGGSYYTNPSYMMSYYKRKKTMNDIKY